MGHKFRCERTTNSCQGLTDKEVEILVNKKYKDFCNYRWELYSCMPDRRISLFDKRVFNGRSFDL